jgi:predicted TIM-barrel fold metal-dependent hydrolase
MVEYPIVSVDDHLLQPRDLWLKRMPRKFLDEAPRVTEVDDHEVWVFGDLVHDSLGLAAAVGENTGGTETWHMAGRYADIRPGAYDPVARLADMDEGGVLAQMCFPEVFGFAGQRLSLHGDKEVSLAAIQAYNDFVLEEWAGAAPGRYIPMIVIPLWDARLAVDEVQRCAPKGAKAIAFPEDTYRLGWPSIYDKNRFWDPLFGVAQETGMPLAMHMGSSSFIPNAGPDAPLLVEHAYSFVNTTYSLIQWMLSDNFERFPSLKCFWAEGDIGWVPYVLQHLDRKWHISGRWTGHPLPNPPSTYVKDHVFLCFIEDPVGIRTIDEIGLDQVMMEVDYPHSDSTWPNSPKIIMEQLSDLPDEDIVKLTRGNAERVFNFQASALGAR